MARRVDEVALVIVIDHLKGFHDDDTIVVQWSFIVLVHFKEARAEGLSAVVLVEPRVFKVVVAMAVVVREDEDEALLTTGIHSVEVEVSVVVDDDLEAVAAWHYSVLALRHDGVVVVGEDGKDLWRLEGGVHEVSWL